MEKTPEEIVAELNRAKAVFQLRTIAAVLDLPLPPPHHFTPKG